MSSPFRPVSICCLSVISLSNIGIRKKRFRKLFSSSSSSSAAGCQNERSPQKIFPVFLSYSGRVQAFSLHPTSSMAQDLALADTIVFGTFATCSEVFFFFFAIYSKWKVVLFDCVCLLTSPFVILAASFILGP